MVNGNLTGGFAFVAYPAEYRNSGVMTFIVNQDGIVYEKDLGADTDKTCGRNDGVQPRQHLDSRRLKLLRRGKAGIPGRAVVLRRPQMKGPDATPFHGHSGGASFGA